MPAPRAILALMLSATIAITASVPAIAQSEPLLPAADLAYDMVLRDPPEQLHDTTLNGNFGNLTFFEEPAAAYGEEGSGDTTFLSFTGGEHVWSNEQVQAPSEFTIEVEFRTKQAGGKLLGFEDQTLSFGTLNDRVLYIGTDGLLRFAGANSVSAIVPSLGSVTDGEWHRAVAVAFISNFTVVYELYLDGVFQGTATGRTTNSYPGHWRIGSGNISGWPEAGTQPYFVGDVSSVRITNSAPVQEPQPTPTSTVVPPTPTVPVTPAPGPTEPSLWLDAADTQGAASVMFDLSGNGNFGFLRNFEDADSAFGTEPVPPVLRFLSFDGVDDWVSTDTVTAAPTELSLAVWFRTEGTGGKIAGFEDSPFDTRGTQTDRHLYIDRDGHVRFGVKNGTTFTVRGAFPVNDGQWHLAIATLRWTGTEYMARLFLDGFDQGANTSALAPIGYNGYWRMGNGNLDNWPGATSEPFAGDIGSLRVYNRAMTFDEMAELWPGSSVNIITPTPIPFGDEPDHHMFIDITPRVDVSGNIDGETLTLDIAIRNVDAPGSEVWVVREEDGEQFMVGLLEPLMTWEGEARTGRYRVEVREEQFGEELDATSVIASGSVPVFAQPASGVEVAAAVAVTVAVAGAASAASASGTWIYELVWRFLRIIFAEKLRRRTRNLDISTLPSWVAATVAMVLMALLVAIARPGALELGNFAQALAVSVPVVILFRLVTILGGYALAFYTRQEPKYLVWAAGSVSFAITSIVLHSPIGYTGYMDRAPTDKERDARFAVAGFAAVLSLAGLFLIIGLLTKVSFAETGVPLALGALAVMMLPFPLMAGNKIWAWNRAAGVVCGVVGMLPYILFQLGYFTPTGVALLATIGLLSFGGILMLELWLIERQAMRDTEEATAAAKAVAEGASAV